MGAWAAEVIKDGLLAVATLFQRVCEDGEPVGVEVAAGQTAFLVGRHGEGGDGGSHGNSQTWPPADKGHGDYLTEKIGTLLPLTKGINRVPTLFHRPTRRSWHIRATDEERSLEGPVGRFPPIAERFPEGNDPIARFL